ncbi:MAG: type II secretion system major pseudopilin GspG [Verrucomicrobiota bacterium]|nr:type II secretion system major pseudopilin GspG [Verrucomicrobiota bacterium]
MKIKAASKNGPPIANRQLPIGGGETPRGGGPGHRPSARGKSRGFTLVELLLVLVILATLAAIVLPKFTGTSQRARITAATTQISTFKTALGAYEVDMGYYPKSLNDLIQQPGGNNAQNWHGPYLDNDTVPADPWGNPYVYVCPGKHNPSSFDVSSAGPDGQPGTADDIGNWTMSK